VQQKIDWGNAMKTCALLLPLFAATALSTGALARTAAPVATTTSGKVSGAVEDGVASWKGIPFAAPPVGPLRWRAPQPPAKWPGVRAATEYSHDCMQKPFDGDAAPLGTPPAEDCLYLNVWKPADATGKLPVVFWVYGGGFINGGSSPPTYSGANLARKGVVFVSFNYRLGRFGTFAHPALTRANEDKGLLANYGYMDQVAALRWVRANIAAFGGDPANITAIGESAGGGSVHMLLTSPMTQGMVRRAVIMSGGAGEALMGGAPRDAAAEFAAAEAIGVNFAETKGIAAEAPDALARLRALPAETVVDGLNLGSMMRAVSGKRTYSSPIFDGKVSVVPLAAYREGRFNKVPVMVGATSGDIGGPTGPMVAGARRVSAALTDAGVPVYAYRFSYVADSIRGTAAAPLATHASDIPFFFDTQAVKYGAKTTARDKAMGGAISSYIAQFAKTGDPNGAGLPQWPRYDKAKDEIMDFALDGQPRAGRDPLTAPKP
jgi:para-nitrobenzyl esterase